MKPLTSQKVQRGNGDDPEKTLKEWTASEAQLTDEGRSEFWKRQQQRMKDAQSTREEAERVVRPMARKAGKLS